MRVKILRHIENVPAGEYEYLGVDPATKDVLLSRGNGSEQKRLSKASAIQLEREGNVKALEEPEEPEKK